MAHIIQNRKDFIQSRAIKIWEDYAMDGTRCEVWKDQVSSACLVKHFANQAKIKRQMKLIADMCKANYSDKSNNHFTSKKHDGDRIIAQLTSWDLVHHPEIQRDPKELMRFLDANPTRKRIPAMWTRTTPGKRLFGGIKDTAIVKAHG